MTCQSFTIVARICLNAIKHPSKNSRFSDTANVFRTVVLNECVEFSKKYIQLSDWKYRENLSICIKFKFIETVCRVKYLDATKQDTVERKRSRKTLEAMQIHVSFTLYRFCRELIWLLVLIKHVCTTIIITGANSHISFSASRFIHPVKIHL